MDLGVEPKRENFHSSKLAKRRLNHSLNVQKEYDTLFVLSIDKEFDIYTSGEMIC